MSRVKRPWRGFEGSRSPVVLAAFIAVLLIVAGPLGPGLQGDTATGTEEGHTSSKGGTPTVTTPALNDGRMATPGNLYFIENTGQMTPSNIVYYTNDRCRVGFAKAEVFITVPEHPSGLRMTFPGSSSVKPTGMTPTGHKASFIRGDTQGTSVTLAHSYHEVMYEGLYPDIDLRYYWNQGSLKYDFIVHPGGDPGTIAMMYHGVDGLRVEPDGSLTVRRDGFEVRDEDLEIFQTIEGQRRAVAGAFRIISEDVVTIDVLGPYDWESTLVIDPRLSFATYIGGTEYDEVLDMATDGSGNIYLTGITWSSTSFPITGGAFQKTLMGYWDIFVMKLNASGDRVLFSTFIGTQTWEESVGIAVDGDGNVYLVGSTRDLDFPTTTDAYDPVHNGRRDIFVLKLDPQGSTLLYSTFVGGSWFDYAGDIWVDDAGRAVVVGYTFSDDFPTTPRAVGTEYQGNGDAVFLLLSEDGGALVYSTYVGGEQEDAATQVLGALDGRILMAGTTSSPSFPTTPDAHQREHLGNDDGFLIEFDIAATDPMTHGTYIGGSGSDQVSGLALGTRGCIVLAGTTDSSDFPTTELAYSQRLSGGTDCFVVGLDRTGYEVDFSTLIGGSSNEDLQDVAVDSTGCLVLVGSTSSENYPTMNWTFQPSKAAGIDTFITRMSDDAGRVLYSTYMGGSGDETALEIGLDSSDNVIIGGSTNSSNLHTTSGSLAPRYGGSGDGFSTKLDVIPPSFTDDGTDQSVGTGEVLTFDAKVIDNVEVEDVWVEYRLSPGDILQRTMVEGNNTSVFTGDLYVPTGTERLSYRFHAHDVSGNWNSTGWRSVHVIDDEVPQLEDKSPDNGTTGDPYTFRAVASDNIGISSVHVEYWFSEGPRTNTTMLGVHDYEATLILPWDSTKPLHYYITAGDVNGNWATTPARTVIVLDDDPPVFVEDLSEPEGTTGDPFTWEATFFDNIDVTEVRVIYWFPSHPPERSLMEADGTYRLTSVLPSDGMPLMFYKFEAKDRVGNINVTSIMTVTVSDNDPPEFGLDLSDDYGTTGNILTFMVEVEDNLVINSVEVEFWYEGSETRTRHEMARSDLYWHESTVPSNMTGHLHYIFIARDITGNTGETGTVLVPINDDDPPTFGAESSDIRATTGDDFTFRVQVSDNLGVSSVVVIYQIGDDDAIPQAMDDYMATLTIPEAGRGHLRYHFEAVDAAGNSNSTPVVSIVIEDDDPPVAMARFVRSVQERTRMELDGTDSTDNIGVVEWTWTITGEDDLHVLYGSKIGFVFEGKGRYYVNLTVTDADGNQDWNSSWITVKADENPFFTALPILGVILVIVIVVIASVGWNLFKGREDNA